MTVISGLDNDYYYSDSSNDVGYLYVETRVSYYGGPLQKTPLNIAIVIDRSGSMGEDREVKKPFSKLEYAEESS